MSDIRLLVIGAANFFNPDQVDSGEILTWNNQQEAPHYRLKWLLDNQIVTEVLCFDSAYSRTDTLDSIQYVAEDLDTEKLKEFLATDMELVVACFAGCIKPCLVHDRSYFWYDFCLTSTDSGYAYQILPVDRLRDMMAHGPNIGFSSLEKMSGWIRKVSNSSTGETLVKPVVESCPRSVRTLQYPDAYQMAPYRTLLEEYLCGVARQDSHDLQDACRELVSALKDKQIWHSPRSHALRQRVIQHMFGIGYEYIKRVHSVDESVETL